MDNFRFKSIKNEYDGFYRGLLKNGKFPFWSTANGFFGSVISDEVYEAFTKIGLDKNRSFIDLGSGDGKAVLIAALFCNRSVGIEMDPALFKKSLEMQRKLDIPNAIFYNNDYYAHSISEFEVAFVYPDGPMHRGLEKKLMNELTGKLIHYGHHFHPQNLKAEDSFLINGSLFTIYSNK